MLIHGRFQDENGVKYHIPAIVSDGQGSKEQQIVRTAKEIAWSKGVKMVYVWAVYEYEKEIV